MSERKIDLSKLNDFEISMLVIERNVCHYKTEQISELLNRIGGAKGFGDEVKEQTVPFERSEQTSLPNIELGSLPWRSYETKESAQPDEAAWIFSNTKGAEPLLTELKAKDKVQMGNFEYSFSGKTCQFISRNPLRAEKT